MSGAAERAAYAGRSLRRTRLFRANLDRSATEGKCLPSTSVTAPWLEHPPPFTLILRPLHTPPHLRRVSAERKPQAWRAS